jgi:hypothetical protein
MEFILILEILKMTVLNIEIPEQVFAAMRNNPEDFAREMRLAAAACWYEIGKVSQEVAAKISGLNRAVFLLSLSRFGKDSFLVDWRDLEREISRE